MPEVNLERSVTCCFTGHRPDKLPSGWRQDAHECASIRFALRNEIEKAYKSGYRVFISGMAQGADTWAAEEVVKLKNESLDIKLYAALPCPNQDAIWSADARRRFRALLRQADESIIISDKYTPFCMGARNLWMVEYSSMMIALFDGSKGGTANTVAHAERFGLKIIRINPLDYM